MQTLGYRSRCGGPVFDYAFVGLVGGDFVRSSSNVEVGVDFGELLSWWHGIECDLLSGASECGVERVDDDVLDIGGHCIDSVTDEDVCVGDSRRRCLGDVPEHGDDCFIAGDRRSDAQSDIGT